MAVRLAEPDATSFHAALKVVRELIPTEGVTHAFFWKDGKIWLTFAAHRHRTVAIKRDSRRSRSCAATTTSC